MKKLFLFLCLVTAKLFGQSPLLVSGPMLGYVEHQEVLIWLEVSAQTTDVQVEYWEKGKKEQLLSVNYKGELGKAFNPIKIVLTGLKLYTTYEYDIKLNKTKEFFNHPLNFTTKKNWGQWNQKEDPENFSFLLGSCLYINEKGYDRDDTNPYGTDPGMLQNLANMQSDFMLWLGDNVYLREPDFSSAYGIERRYSMNRRNENLQKLIGTRANYATWDDHDYGPNDANCSYDMKQVSLNCFKNYWGNKTYGEADNEGVYGKFSVNDADFFLLDDRYYRYNDNYPDSINGKINPGKKFLGARQMEWLKNQLLNSGGTFKIIVCGSQVLNPINTKECFNHYSAEYTELIDFIKQSRISGILFLSGDRHFTELIKKEEKDFYPLYDFTCSALTSTPYKPKGKELENPFRVTGSFITVNNFGKITVTGERANRELKIQVYNAKAEDVFNYSIKASELKIK
jgi:alkaline phosphatase D